MENDNLNLKPSLRKVFPLREGGQMQAHGTFSRREGGYAYILLGFERGGMDLLKGFVSGRGVI
jgi:hypothetical protein